MNKCGIYQIINLINGKSYIGSSVDVLKRLSIHKSRLNNNKHCNCYLQNAWNKYGEKYFAFIIIEFCDRRDKLAKEQFWIDSLGVADSKRGYNILKTAKTNYRKKVSDETRHKISMSNKGQKRTLKAKKNMSIAQTGKYKEDNSRYHTGMLINWRSKDMSVEELAVEFGMSKNGIYNNLKAGKSPKEILKNQKLKLEYNGHKASLSEWAKILGVHYTTLVRRYKNGLSVEEILNTEKYIHHKHSSP